jgi:ubiquinone/menaquinone biosynthesis C-methylase UbiE
MDRKETNALFQQWKKEESEPFIGWDFSHIAKRCVEEQPPWSYMELAKNLMLTSKAVLDLGTGGGERLLAMKDCFSKRVVATEGFKQNFMLARRRLSPYGVEVVQTESSSLKEKLPFADGEFDLVLNRHSAYNASEVARILNSHGFFFTEQVDGRNLEDLHQEFDCKPQWSFFTLDFALNTIESTKLVVVEAQEWEGKTFFKDVGALVYFLKAIPWIVPGFTVETYFKYLLKLQKRIEKEGKLTFTQRLFLIKAKKSS